MRRSVLRPLSLLQGLPENFRRRIECRGQVFNFASVQPRFGSTTRQNPVNDEFVEVDGSSWGAFVVGRLNPDQRTDLRRPGQKVQFVGWTAPSAFIVRQGHGMNDRIGWIPSSLSAYAEFLQRSDIVSALADPLPPPNKSLLWWEVFIGVLLERVQRDPPLKYGVVAYARILAMNFGPGSRRVLPAAELLVAREYWEIARRGQQP